MNETDNTNSIETEMKKIIENAQRYASEARNVDVEPTSSNDRTQKKMSFEINTTDGFLTAEIKKRINAGTYFNNDLQKFFIELGMDKKKAQSRANNLIHVLSASSAMTDKTLEYWLQFLRLELRLIPIDSELNGI